MLGRYDICEGLIGKGSCEGGTKRRLLGGALRVKTQVPPLTRARGRDARDLLNMLSRELRYLASARSTAEKSSRNSREIEICRGSIYLFYSWSISLIAFFRTVSSI
jgi:hypothetical protein